MGLLIGIDVYWIWTPFLVDSMSNDHIWTASGTNIMVRFRKMGWVPPSEDPAYIKKWADWRAFMARTIDDWSVETPKQKQNTNLLQMRKRK